MTLTKDESIITQVAAKIGSDIAIKLSTGDLETTLSDFAQAFAFAKDELFQAHAFSNVQTVLGGTDVTGSPEATPPTAPAYVAPAVASGALEVAGDQYGPFPAWLEAATAKVGCRKVFDNRGGKFAVLQPDGSLTKTADGKPNKKPWFKQADQANGADPVAFWPPR